MVKKMILSKLIIILLVSQTNYYSYSMIFIDEIDSLFNVSSSSVSSSMPLLLLNIFNLSKYEKSNVILIGISNTVELFCILRQKFCFTDNIYNIVFEPYSWVQMYSILQNRLNDKSCNLKEIFDETSLKFCAKKMHAIKGSDIRGILDLIKQASSAKLATLKNLKEDNDDDQLKSPVLVKEKITSDDINKVFISYYRFTQNNN